MIGCLALLGSRIPSSLRIFMLSLAITDDVGAILVVAIGYSSHVAWAPLTLGVGACFLVRGMAALGVRSVPVYFVVGAGLLLLDTSSRMPEPLLTQPGDIFDRRVPEKRLYSRLNCDGLT